MNTPRIVIGASVLALGLLGSSIASAANCWVRAGVETCHEQCKTNSDCTRHCAVQIPGLCSGNRVPTGNCGSGERCRVLTPRTLVDYQCSPC